MGVMDAVVMGLQSCGVSPIRGKAEAAVVVGLLFRGLRMEA